MAIPIICPTCNAAYSDLKLPPGSTFGCGECGHVLHVPGAPPVAGKSLPSIKPTRSGTARAGAQSPPVPAAESVSQGIRPVVAPKARGPGPAPVQKAPSQVSLAAPSTDQEVATPSSQRSAITRRDVPKKSITDMAKARADRSDGDNSKSSKKGLIIGGSILLVGVIAVISALLMSGRTTEDDRDQAYVQAYVEGAKLRYKSQFGAGDVDSKSLYTTYEASVGKKDIFDVWHEGFDAGKKGKRPYRAASLATSQVERAEIVLPLIDEAVKTRSNSADALWQIGQNLIKLADSWKASGIPAAEVSKLTQRRESLVKKILEVAPDFVEARTERGEVRYQDDLLSYTTADYLNEAQRAIAKKAHDKLTNLAASRGGWIAKADFEEVNRVKGEFAVREKADAAVKETPFHAQAMAMKDETGRILAEAMIKAKENYDRIREEIGKQISDENVRKALEAAMTRDIKDIEFEAVVRPPYVVFVEKSPSWNASLRAEENAAKPLAALNRSFWGEYGDRFQLKALEKPVPVVFLKDIQSYQQYCMGTMGGVPPGVEAHFEPETGRLIVYSESNWTVMLHEGTHQLLHHYRKVSPDFKAQSFWFEEGAAEWFSGCNRTVNPATKDWDYEIGLLQEARFKDIGKVIEGKHEVIKAPLSLKELVTSTYASRDAWTQSETYKVYLTYAQGWMLIYFLNYFDVDSEGIVKVDTKEKPVRGKYRQGWEKYLEFELCGKDGKPFTGIEAFREALQLDDSKFEQLAKEFELYQKFVIRKLKLRHVKDKRLIPWNEYVNTKREKSGLKEDDVLDLAPPK